MVLLFSSFFELLDEKGSTLFKLICILLFFLYRCCQGRKILGCPIYIDNKNYARNALIFNLCFVFDADTNTVPYENVVKKVAGYFTTLEVRF